MAILMWIIFGLITGVIASIIDPNPVKGGVLGTIILGISGALLGGFLGNTILGLAITGFSLSSFLIAILGSLLFLFIARALSSKV